jgi:arginyl-tRNA synthetase
MFEEFEEQALTVLKKVMDVKEAFDIKFEEPIEEYGDISTPVCFDLAGILKKSPKQIAEDFVEKVDAADLKGTCIKEVKSKMGYINFYLDYEKIAPKLIKRVRDKKDEYGRGKIEENKNKNVIVEHTSANPDGPIHIGHARNAIIGDTLSRVMRFAGYDIETQFYINDMGKQLAVVVWGLSRDRLDETKKNDRAILDVYVKANEMVEENAGYQSEISNLMRKYESGDREVINQFEYAANHCLTGIKETLEKAGIHHDRFVWESTFVRDSSVKKVVERLKDTRYLKEDEVIYLDLEEFGIKKELILMRKDGTYLYTTRDIAYHIWKSERGAVIDVLGADHKLVSQQLSASLKILGVREPEYIIYEFISLPGGSMSTRKGVFISMDELIEESIKRAYMEVEKRRPDDSVKFKKDIAENVGIGAVRFNIVRVSHEKAITFRWEDALDFESQGAPFIQYAYARACRILEKDEKGSLQEDFLISGLTKNEKRLIKAISKFPYVVKNSASSRRPSLLANYVIELANTFHRFYMYDRVLNSEAETFRLNLVYATKVTLENSLNILGIKPLEKM